MLSILSIEDASLILGGAVAIAMWRNGKTNSKESTMKSVAVVKETKEMAAERVEKERLKREAKKRSSSNPLLIRRKEKLLLDRGVVLPAIPEDDPADYEATLDVLLDGTSDQTPAFIGKEPGVDETDNKWDFPNAGRKTTSEMFNRAGRMAGLTIPLVAEEDEANWLN